MELGGPLKDTKLLGYIPGPGRYDANKSQLDQRASSMRQKLPDTSQRHLLKVVSVWARTRGQEPTSPNRSAAACIMQLPSSRITPITKSIPGLGFQRLLEGQRSKWVQWATRPTLKISTAKGSTIYPTTKAARPGSLTGLRERVSFTSTWSAPLHQDNSTCWTIQRHLLGIRMTHIFVFLYLYYPCKDQLK